MRRFVTVLGIVLILYYAPLLGQQTEATVPVGLQVAMIKKIYSYLNLGQPLKVCVIAKSKELRGKAEEQLKQIGVQFEALDDTQSPASDCSVVLLLADVPKVSAKKIATAKKVVFSTDRELIADGCCVGIGVVLDNGRPQILLNISKLDGLGVKPDPNFISKMAKII